MWVKKVDSRFFLTSCEHTTSGSENTIWEILTSHNTSPSAQGFAIFFGGVNPPFKCRFPSFIWAHMFNLHWWLSRHVFLQCCVYVQIHKALLCLCLYVSIKYGRVIFPMCRQLRWNSPRGRAESWSTSQRGSWYHICLNMSSIQVMELLRFPLNNPLLLCSSYRWTHCKKCKR